MESLLLRAKFAGSHIGADWSARCVSVHRAALNLSLPNGLLVSLISESGSMTSHALLLDRSPDFDRVRRSIAPGATGGCSGRILSIGGLELSFVGVSLYTGTVRPLLGVEPRADVRRLLAPATRALRASRLRQLLAHSAPEESLFSAIARKTPSSPFARRARQLLFPAERFAEGAAGRTLRRRVRLEGLVGLGQGFTPAGDDFITGALLGRALLREAAAAAGRTLSVPARRFVGSVHRAAMAAPPHIDRDRIAARLGGTSAGGRTLLAAALRGSFPAYLLDVGRALAMGRPDLLARSVGVALNHGETSGADACSGVLWYLESVV